mgnify:CR=1 FL=1
MHVAAPGAAGVTSAAGDSHCPIYDHLRSGYADLFPPDLPHPSLDFCPKTRLELPHSSMAATFAASAMRT